MQSSLKVVISNLFCEMIVRNQAHRISLNEVVEIVNKTFDQFNSSYTDIEDDIFLYEQDANEENIEADSKNKINLEHLGNVIEMNKRMRDKIFSSTVYITDLGSPVPRTSFQLAVNFYLLYYILLCMLFTRRSPSE